MKDISTPFDAVFRKQLDDLGGVVAELIEGIELPFFVLREQRSAWHRSERNRQVRWVRDPPLKRYFIGVIFVHNLQSYSYRHPPPAVHDATVFLELSGNCKPVF